MVNWLQKNRDLAEGKFQSLPLPAAKDENFRFTALDEINFDESLFTSRGQKNSDPVVLDESEICVLAQMGAETKLLGHTKGFDLTSLQSAVDNENRILEQKLNSSTAFSQDKFAQMAMARWETGAFLQVGEVIEKPIRIVQWVGLQKSSALRNLFIVNENASATLILEMSSDEEDRLISELSEVYLEKNANLHLILVQNFGERTKAFQRHSFCLGENALLKITSVHVGSEKIQIRKEADLAGAGARLEIFEAARGNRSQHFDFWSDVKHQAPRTVSSVDQFFVMNEKSRAVFNGLVQVEKQATDCDAYQKSKSLLLSSQATVHAIPKLIIQTDAVKCSHGASVSSVNPEQVHYLQSRGITKKEAEQMIVHGFTEPVVARIAHENLYERVESYLEKKSGEALQ